MGYYFGMQNVAGLIFDSTVDDNSLFLSSSSFTYTYGQAKSLIVSIATGLRLVKEWPETSAILVPAVSDPRAILCFYAIAFANLSYAPIPVDASADYVAYATSLTNAKASIKFGDASFGDGLLQLDFETLVQTKADPNVLAEAKKNWGGANPLYYVFTSGSTGKPKCIAKSHRNILSFVSNFLQTIPLQKGSRLANQTPLSFDASAKDVYLTPAVGGALFFPERTFFALPAKLIDYLNQNKITSIFWVPSALTIIAKTRTLNYVKPATLQNVLFVGEVFQPKYLNMWLDALPEISFYNLFGLFTKTLPDRP